MRHLSRCLTPISSRKLRVKYTLLSGENWPGTRCAIKSRT